MFAYTALAQAATAAAGAGADQGPLAGLLQSPLPLMVIMFGAAYFLLIRPQQKRAKELKAAVEAMKRGDTVVLTSGLIGKVVRVEDAEVQLEIAPTVTVRVIKSYIQDIRTKGEPAPANDSKAA